MAPPACLQDANTARAATEALAAVVRVVNDASAEGDIESLASRLVEIAVDLIDADKMTIFLVDELKNELYPLAATELAALRNVRIPVGRNSLAGSVALSGEPVNVVDALLEPHLRGQPGAAVALASGVAEGDSHAAGDSPPPPPPSPASRSKSRSVLCVPVKLRGAGTTTAVIEAVNKRSGGVFSKTDEALLQAFASELGVLIDRKRLQLTYDKVRAARDVRRRMRSSLTSGSLFAGPRRRQRGRRRCVPRLVAPDAVHERRRRGFVGAASPCAQRRWRGPREVVAPAIQPRLIVAAVQRVVERPHVGGHAEQPGGGADEVRGQPRHLVAEPCSGGVGCDCGCRSQRRCAGRRRPEAVGVSPAVGVSSCHPACAGHARPAAWPVGARAPPGPVSPAGQRRRH